jgi:hypothetical protein
VIILHFYARDGLLLKREVSPQPATIASSQQVDLWQEAKLVERLVVTNAGTRETLKPVPSPEGRRVGRKALRRLMGEGIDVQAGSFLRKQWLVMKR